MNGREVLIGVSGGIAAYKTAALVSRLAQSGAGISVAMTAAAQRFVGKATFAALSGRSVATDVFEDDEFPLGAHICLAQRAELYCIAPATANFLAKAAQGIADDLVTTLYLCARCPILVAPAMNCEMWEHVTVQRNLTQLREDGVEILQPEEGWLSCRQQGMGRMASPETIFDAISRRLK